MKKGLVVMLDNPLKEKIREMAFKNKISMGNTIRIILNDRFRKIELQKEAQRKNGTGQSI